MKTLLAIILLTASAFASTQGPGTPGTVTTIAGPDGNTWSNPTNVKAADFALAQCLVTTTGACDSLVMSGFPFGLPTGATVTGVTVIINRKQAGTGSIKDTSVVLLKGLSAVGANKANTTLVWPTSLTSATYGSSSDTWSTSFTGADVNGSGFGVKLDVTGTTASGVTASIDFITITVDYVTNFGITTAETVTVSPAVGLNRQRTLSESATISPSVGAVYGGNRSTPESVGVSPTVSYIHNGKSVTSDTLTVTDSAARVATRSFAISESLSISPSLLVVFPRATSESLSVSDSVVVVQSLKRTFAESISLSISGVGSAASIRAVSEPLSISDTALRQIALHRGISDSGTLADAIARRMAFKPGPLEIVNIQGVTTFGYVGRPFDDVQVQDLALPAHSIRPLIAESLGVSPSVLGVLPRFKLISELMAVGPAIRVSHLAVRSESESSSVQGVLSTTAINVTPHSEKDTIGQSVTLSEVLVVSVRSSTKKRAVIVMSL